MGAEPEPGLSEQYRRASPWPLFVALGIPIAEVGIVFDLFPIAVGGLLLFGGSAAGMATEAGYAKTPWRALVGAAVPFAALGLGFVYTPIDLPDRGYAILAAAAILVAIAVAGRLFAQDADPPY
ncbi:DUF7541 family protein [Halobellus ruber]|uniref:Cox cluster protein n=1 Tax=Halobellus ruber TaxID=2761102 RepID=A0A7J9SG58_9EURY|nr:cox cluster protein [Halobellus ruber]MBB6645945.1 cox cluster protein [Halobellus ruber]